MFVGLDPGSRGAEPSEKEEEGGRRLVPMALAILGRGLKSVLNLMRRGLQI